MKVLEKSLDSYIKLLGRFGQYMLTSSKYNLYIN